MNTIKLSTFEPGLDEAARTELWSRKKAKAAFVIAAANDEFLSGDNLELTDDETFDVIEAVDSKEPYGPVQYADDKGFQPDGKKRYPIDTAEHVRAAWSYLAHPKNAGKYSSEQLSHIKGRIISAWKRLIDPSGPPSADKK